MAQSECVVILADGTRRCVDVFSRSADWAAALEAQQVQGLEFHHFRFDKQLSLEQLDRLFNSTRASHLRSLVLEDCVLTDRVVAFVVETFVRDTQLESLVVRHCRQLSMTSLMAVASLIKTAPLVTLELSSCYLARQAGILLGQSLQTSRLLKRIDVSGNNLRDGGIKAIADAVRAGQAPTDSLDELDCSSNGISATGLAALVAIQVKRLTVSDNSINGFIPTVISSNRQLESLDVSSNSLSEDALRELLSQALQAPHLTSLNIQNCNLSQLNEDFLVKSMLLKAKTAKGCALQELHIGEKPDVDVLLDSDKDEDSLPATRQDDRLAELKRSLETRVPGLAVHLLDTMVVSGAQEQRRENEEGDCRYNRDDREHSAVYDVELETPGRQLRRELLERTEFMRRHSEELPLADDDESLASFVSDKLVDKCEPPKPILRNAVSSVYHGGSDGENDMHCVARRASALSSSSFNHQRQLSHAASNASFFLNTNPSLDDVASQFSIDPPPSAMTSTLQNMDVEFIVSRTIETMNRNFEQRLSQFLMRMEFQQQEKNATQLQMLAAKVEACERAIPRLEARLDVLADRIATSGAQVGKMQTEWQAKLLSPPPTTTAVASSLAVTVPLTVAMQSQVEELVANRLRASENQLQGDVALLRREVVATTAAAQSANPQAVVDAVSLHLTQFKQEFDANQSTVLRRFTENIVKDGVRVDERMQQLEGKVAHLEGIIQAEQHASLLALEAISEAFAGNNNTQSLPASTPVGGGGGFAPVAPLPPPPPQQPPIYVSKPIQQHGYTAVHR